MNAFKNILGETSWLPQLPQLTGDPQYYPDYFVRDFVEVAAEFGDNVEVRVGRGTQDVPLFLRMIDKDSVWGLNNGLQSVITTALQVCIGVLAQGNESVGFVTW